MHVLISSVFVRCVRGGGGRGGGDHVLVDIMHYGLVDKVKYLSDGVQRQDIGGSQCLKELTVHGVGLDRTVIGTITYSRNLIRQKTAGNSR